MLSGFDLIAFGDSFLWGRNKEGYQPWWPETAAHMGYWRRRQKRHDNE